MIIVWRGLGILSLWRQHLARLRPMSIQKLLVKNLKKSIERFKLHIAKVNLNRVQNKTAMTAMSLA